MVATLDPEGLSDYLREQSGAGCVTRLRRIGGGASRETWLVELDAPTATLPRLLVIRKDTVSGGVVPTSLDREFRVLQALAANGVQVPTPYWYEADPARFGTPFYVRQGFEGTSDQGRFEGETAQRLSTELAQALARLHRLDPHVLQLPDTPVPATVPEATAQEVERWAVHRQQTALEPMPMFEEITWWLRRNRPQTDEHVSVLWGDVGIANTVCSPDGRVLALSDWELAGFGDPMRDVATALWRGVDRLAGREAFLQAYVAAGGRAIDEQRIAYFDVFANWQVAMFTHTSIAGSQPGGGRSLHPALLSIWAQRINLHKAGRRIGV